VSGSSRLAPNCRCGASDDRYRTCSDLSRRSRLLPRFGSHLSASITKADIAAFMRDTVSRSPTANRFICVVRKMSNVGRQLDMIPEELPNPGTEIQRFPEHKRRRYVTPAKMPRLAAAINDDPNEFAGHALWLLLLTGLRRNEILAAKCSDVDWDNKTLFYLQNEAWRICVNTAEPSRHCTAQDDPEIQRQSLYHLRSDLEIKQTVREPLFDLRRR
jgi:integrase